MEVAMPQGWSKLFAVEFAAESAPVIGISEQLVALELVAQVQCCGSCAELFEDRQIDSIGIQLERYGQVLQPNLRAQHRVEQPRPWPEGIHRPGRRLRVRRH